jgi:hypothetical protein
VTEGLDHRRQQQVVGTEVVTPAADAVGLVNDEQRRPGLAQGVEHVALAQLLRREEEELDVAGADAVQRGPALRDANRGVGRRGAVRDAHQAGHLVSLEGDQRADDDGWPLEQERGQLVDRRLARTGGQHRERVAAVEDGRDRFTLAGSQRVEAEAFTREGRDRSHVGGHGPWRTRRERLLHAGRGPVVRQGSWRAPLSLRRG